MEISTINQQVQQESIFVQDLKREISKVIVGQEALLDKMLVALLVNDIQLLRMFKEHLLLSLQMFHARMQRHFSLLFLNPPVLQ